MTPDEAYAIIRRCLVSGRYQLSGHARRERMGIRNVTPRDILNAVRSATHCAPADDGCWEVIGPDVQGVELRLIVAVEDDDEVTIITLTG